jgi:hypothetical protein
LTEDERENTDRDTPSDSTDRDTPSDFTDGDTPSDSSEIFQGFEPDDPTWETDTGSGTTVVIDQSYTNTVRSGSGSCLIRMDDSAGVIFSPSLNTRDVKVECYFSLSHDPADGRVIRSKLFHSLTNKNDDSINFTFKNSDQGSGGDGTENYDVLIEDNYTTVSSYGSVKIPQKEFVRLEYTTDTSDSNIDYTLDTSQNTYTDTLSIPKTYTGKRIGISYFNSFFATGAGDGDMIIDDITVEEL